MRVLIACEYSGVVRDAFIAKGHDAISCDLLPTEMPGPHIQGDVIDNLSDGWDMMIAFPPCTYLSNAGICHLKDNPDRYDKMLNAVYLFNMLINCGIDKTCVENPTMHRFASQLICRPANDLIDPKNFGHTQQKRTLLWLDKLPPLMSTAINTRASSDWYLLMPESKFRKKFRSITREGVAQAMADQWG